MCGRICLAPVKMEVDDAVAQQDKDENDERERTIVKRKKPCNPGHVSKRLIKLRAPRRVGEYVQQ